VLSGPDHHPQDKGRWWFLSRRLTVLMVGMDSTLLMLLKVFWLKGRKAMWSSVGGLKRAIFSLNPISLLWQKTAYHWNWPFSYLPLSVAQSGLHFLIPSCGSVWHLSFQPAYVTPNFNPEDEGSMFLWNVSIYLQEYSVSQPRRP
jgi:hypothetical protein